MLYFLKFVLSLLRLSCIIYLIMNNWFNIKKTIEFNPFVLLKHRLILSPLIKMHVYSFVLKSLLYYITLVLYNT